MPLFGKLKQDGGEYEGEYERRIFGLKSVRHGDGMQTWPDGKIYDGSWVDGKRHGQGKLTFPCGSVFEGEFRDGKVHGAGLYKWPDGSYYEGDYFRGYRQGKGKYFCCSDSYFYEGDFLRDKQQGRGSLQFLDGRHFAGRFHDGQPMDGVFTDYEGTSFDVTFLDRSPSDASKGLFHWMREGIGFKFKTKSRVQMDPGKRAALLQDARDAASLAHPKSKGTQIQQEKKPTRVETLADDEDVVDDPNDPDGYDSHFQKYSDWDRFKQQMQDCGLSMTDLEMLYLKSLEEASAVGTPAASHLRKSASFGSAMPKHTSTPVASTSKNTSDWDSFCRSMGDTGLSMSELAALYSQSKQSASKESAGYRDMDEDSESDLDEGSEGEWERFRRQMRDTGLSEANLSALFHKSKQAASAGPAAARQRPRSPDAADGRFASDYDRFKWEMRGCGLSQADVARLYKQSVSAFPTADGGDVAAAAEGDGGDQGPRRAETDWERFRREMGDTGLSLTELASLYRKSKEAAQRNSESFKRAASFDSRKAAAPPPAPGGDDAPPPPPPPRTERHGEGARHGDAGAAAGGTAGASARGDGRRADRPPSAKGDKAGRAKARRADSAGDKGERARPAAGAGDVALTRTVSVREALMNKMMKETSAALDKLAPKLAELSAAAAISPQALLQHIFARHPPKRDGEAVPTDFSDAAMRKNLLRAIRAYHEDKNTIDQHGLEWHLLCREITKQLNAKLELFK